MRSSNASVRLPSETREIAKTTSLKLLDCWCKVPSEHQRLEFEEAKTDFKIDKVKEYCVAIANDGGGIPDHFRNN